VSVVIPCYNAAGYLGDAIRCALEQTYSPVEIVVVDDGSTDDSREVMESFGESIRCLSGPHRGASAARNRGWRASRGELIQFLDADDLIAPQKLERQVPLADPATVVFCDCHIVAEGGAPRRPVMRPYTGGDPFLYLLDNHVPMMAALYPRALLESVGGFDESLPCAQEYDLNLRLAAAGALWRHLPERLCTWRQVPGSLSSDERRVYQQQVRIFERLARMLGEQGRLSPRHRRALARAQALDREGWREAYSPLARSLLPLVGPVLLERLSAFRRRSGSRRS